ncbi:hypothetical protein ABZ553_00110 [Streptomyces sparsogenes]|uniref:hypothetical protein n=1 Tax=Streptomyces sparsogenes TaxID=67365 RepID=UPI0033D2D9E2
MLTYHQVMTIDLSLLETAATKWDEAAKKFEAVQKVYDSQVKSVGLDGTWNGQALLVARPDMQKTGEQFGAAPKEARAIASLLRDAHTQFVELRGKVKSAVADAVKAGMKVSEDGRASYDFSKVSQEKAFSLKHDPDLHATELSWTEHIAAAVKAVDDADQGVKLALKAAAQDPDILDGVVNGFNGKAEGDIEKVEAQEAQDLSTKLNSGEKLSAKEMAEYQRLFRDNQHDKTFSQTFLAGMGPKGTIELANRYFDLAKGDDKDNFRDLEKGLATTLATATQSPSDPFYKKWRDGLKKAGVEKYDLDAVDDKISVGLGHGQGARGYQSLVTLMKQGRGYSRQFLSDVTDDMIAAERKDKNIWDLYGEFSGKNDGWFANDPVDGALDIMSRDPKIATSYLDPTSDGGNDRLKYLLRERDWDVRNTVNSTGKVEIPGNDAPDADVRSGFGRALEVAATGNEPGTDHVLGYHTDAEARVMRETIKVLDDGRNGSHIPDQLRQPLAHMLVDYTPDVHETLKGRGVYMDRDGVWNDTGDPKGAHMAVGKDSLARILRGVAEDGDAFRQVYDAEKFYAAGTLSTTDFQKPDDRAAVIEEASHVFGVYDGVGADIVSDKKDDRVSWANHFQTGEFVATGGMQAGVSAAASLAGKSSVYGFSADVVYRILYGGFYGWKEDEIAAANAEAAKITEGQFIVGQHNVNHMVAGWAKENGYGLETGLSRHLVGSGQEEYDRGRREALDIYLKG